jgi:hypothetical protein
VYSQALVEGIPNLMDIPYILEVYGVLGVIGDIPSTLLLGFWSLIPVSGRLIALVCRVTCIQLEVHWRNPFSHVLNVLIEQVFSTNPLVPFNCLSATLSSWKHSTPHEMRFLQPQCCPFSRGVTGCRNVPERKGEASLVAKPRVWLFNHKASHPQAFAMHSFMTLCKIAQARSIGHEFI